MTKPNRPEHEKGKKNLPKEGEHLVPHHHRVHRAPKTLTISHEIDTKHKKKVRFKVFRINPAAGIKPHYDTFDLSIHEGTTVLEALDEIKWHQDGTLSYRKSCRSAICGSCAMRVNGHPKLACRTNCFRELELFDEITIEPMNNMKAMKDLVTDMEGFLDKMKKAQNFLIPEYDMYDTDVPTKMSRGQVKMIDKAADCIMCGCCHSDCDAARADPNFLGPAAFVKAFRFAGDIRDSKTRERLKFYVEKGGLWSCVHAMECVQACPKGIDPTDKIAQLRQMAIDHGFTRDYGAKHALSTAKGIRNTGKLREFFLPIETFGLGKLIDMVPMTVDLALHGKMPSPRHKETKDMKSVRTLLAEGEKWKTEEEKERGKMQ